MIITILIPYFLDICGFPCKGIIKIALFPSHQKGCAQKFICKCLSLLPVYELTSAVSMACDIHRVTAPRVQWTGLCPVDWLSWSQGSCLHPRSCWTKAFPYTLPLSLLALYRLLQHLLKPSLGIPGASPTVIHPILTAHSQHYQTLLFSK